MTTDDANAKGFTLKRWSQRKLAAARAVQPPEPVDNAAITTAPEAVAAPEAPPAAPLDEAALPPVESLGVDSDFTGFFKPKVDEGLKRQALKRLLRDPRFNVMDGLDTYIDDYSQPDPIAPEIVREMVQGRYIFDPPRTRVNAEGVVEDVPPDEPAPTVEGAEALPAPEGTADQAPTPSATIPDAVPSDIKAPVASNPPGDSSR